MILGIDPGNEQSAFVAVDHDYQIEFAEKVDNGSMVHMMGQDYVCRHNITDVCIEMIQSYGMPVGRTVFDTCRWVGRFEQKAAEHSIRVHLYARPAIFRAVTGQSRGGDAALRQALLTRFGGDKKGEPMNILKGGGSDKRAAFAVAVYHPDGAKLGEW